MTPSPQLIKDILRLTPDIEQYLESLKACKTETIDPNQIVNALDNLFACLKPVGERADDYMRTFNHG